MLSVSPGFFASTKPSQVRGTIVTEGLTPWETTRLSKHFILLDFLADHEVYRQPGRRDRARLQFDKVWNEEHDELARGLCNELLEPLMMDKRFGPISVADAFWPVSVFPSRSGHLGSGSGKHRWAGGEATVDIALYRLVDEGSRGSELRKAVLSTNAINGCLDRVMSYPETEFVCVTFKRDGAKKCGSHYPRKTQNLRAHHVRVGRYFNLLDFCRNGRGVEQGIDLVPKGAENNDGREYSPVSEEVAARSFAAALDPLVDRVGRISVVRGMETTGFSGDEHADLHRWDGDGPWRLVFVLPQGTDPDGARDLLVRCPNVQDVQPFRHASDSYTVALVIDQRDYDEHRGLRPDYRTSLS